MSNPTRTRKTINVPVIAYPEGVIVGHVRSGKNGKGVTRHVATSVAGQRIGTFDMFREASDALLSWHRKGLDELRTSDDSEPAPLRVELVEAPSDRAQYGIRYLSRYVFRTSKGSSPTRIVVWSNANRPNPRDGEPVRYTEYGLRDGGHGRYLDPQNKATDHVISILMSPEASVLSAHGDSTGTEASGQVYLPAGTRIAEGAELQLVYPNGDVSPVLLAHFTNNGHGRLATLDGSDIDTPEATPTETPMQRRERLVVELVAETLDVDADSRYARAYGILAGLVRGLSTDTSAAELAREYVRQMDRSGFSRAPGS